MNVQNSKGLDANGNIGRDLFSLRDVEVYSTKDNVNKLSDISIRISAGESAKITRDTYELARVNDEQFSITKYDANGKVNEPSIIFDPSEITPDSHGYYKIEELGLDIRIESFDKIDGDDVFQFIPTEGAAKNLALNAKNGDALALSAPIGVNTDSNNLSDAKISLESIKNTDPNTSAFAFDATLYPNAPHKISFTSPTSYIVQDASGTVLAEAKNVTSYNSLLEQAGLASEAGFDVSVSSQPQVGDEFFIGTDNVDPADNFNGMELVNLQNKLLVEGEQSLSKSFAGFVAYVGNKTAELAGHAESSEIIMNDSMARRDRLSAVSLDEEAVNLLKYQQSYSAAAQVVTAARTTFETLLGIMR
ncbi:flagellar basal body rod C-terminal domain-containing protein [Marinomonas sp. GJ51-6]|uniref:flagellar basal body rod C-terminal domain-containing protein n=1 Tax=Marinomonas sp. GJ51-6 TaxID=2992802 RepID=UPI00397756E0